MKIAIDARWIFSEVYGIGAYTRELIRNLALLDKQNKYVLLFNDEFLRDRTVTETNLHDAHNFSTQLLSYGVFSIRNQLLLPGILKRNNVDIFHSTNYMIPLLAFPRNQPGRIKCVVTVHDVIPMLFPSHAPKSRKSRLFPIYKRLMREVGARSDIIFADSESSRMDVLKHLRIPEQHHSKVRALCCGVSRRFKLARATAKEKQTGTDRIVLYAGRQDPYKNLVGLLNAFSLVRQRCDSSVRLKIIGSPDPRYSEAMTRAKELGISDAVEWTGYLSDTDQVAAYRSADVLVHVPLYEGFGLTVVEAMACGIPVICSNAGSLPEVAGNAAIMVDPDDGNGLAEQMQKVLADPQLAADMAEKGIAQASKFTWSQTAAETLAVYEEVGAQTPVPRREK